MLLKKPGEGGSPCCHELDGSFFLSLSSHVRATFTQLTYIFFVPSQLCIYSSLFSWSSVSGFGFWTFLFSLLLLHAISICSLICWHFLSLSLAFPSAALYSTCNCILAWELICKIHRIYEPWPLHHYKNVSRYTLKSDRALSL